MDSEKQEMRKNRFGKAPENVRLDPESRVCPAFDAETDALYWLADPEEMGFLVRDNFCEEHIQ